MPKVGYRRSIQNVWKIVFARKSTHKKKNWVLRTGQLHWSRGVNLLYIGLMEIVDWNSSFRKLLSIAYSKSGYRVSLEKHGTGTESILLSSCARKFLKDSYCFRSVWNCLVISIWLPNHSFGLHVLFCVCMTMANSANRTVLLQTVLLETEGRNSKSSSHFKATIGRKVKWYGRESIKRFGLKWTFLTNTESSEI